MARARSGERSPHGLRALGTQGERLAERYLVGQGFRIIARNVHLRHAEIDLLALEEETLCFIEVKLRTSDAFGTPAEAVGRRKRLRISRAAAQLLATWPLPSHRRVRFDVVAIDAAHHPPLIRLIRDAFSA